MTVYYGVVRGKTVVLPDDADLRDGDTVEVRPVDPAEDDRLETLLEQDLVERGVLSDLKPSPRSVPNEERRLIEIQGEPLSETIIRERR